MAAATARKVAGDWGLQVHHGCLLVVYLQAHNGPQISLQMPLLCVRQLLLYCSVRPCIYWASILNDL
jgi:hypothetical protein